MSKFHLGILAWHNTPAMNGLFDLWHELLIEKGKQGIAGGAIDDWTFSAAAYMSKDVRWNILPPNYCCRFIFPYIVRGEVKVLHGRSENYSGLIKKINENIGIRVGYNDTILARYEPGIGFINCMKA